MSDEMRAILKTIIAISVLCTSSFVSAQHVFNLDSRPFVKKNIASITDFFEYSSYSDINKFPYNSEKGARGLPEEVIIDNKNNEHLSKSLNSIVITNLYIKKELKDLFFDEKISRREKIKIPYDSSPIITNSERQIRVFNQNNGIKNIVSFAELGDITSNINSVLLKSGYKVTQTKSNSLQYVEDNNIEKIVLNDFGSAHYILYCALVSIDVTNTNENIQGTEDYTFKQEYTLTVEFTLINTETHQFIASFSASGTGKDMFLGKRNSIFTPKTEKITRDLINSFNMDLVKKVSVLPLVNANKSQAELPVILQAPLNAEYIKQQPITDSAAIVIGIEKYKRVVNADYASADAQDFYAHAHRGFGIKSENIKLLLDENAEDLDILQAFQNWLPTKVKKGKTDVYVFFSGHGYPSEDGKGLYFLPYGVDKNYLDRTAVKMQDLISVLQTIQPKSVTFFIDSCYSGQTRGGDTLVAGSKPIAFKQTETGYPKEFVVMTASTLDQISWSSPNLKHGIFSYYLMKGMESDADLNKDGKITVAEMQEYLTDMVGRQALGMNRKQQPQLFGDPDRVLVGK